jgi:hypothetical protein
MTRCPRESRKSNCKLPQSKTPKSCNLKVANIAKTTLLQPSSDLREDGLITFRANEVRVHDWERLRSVAGFDPAYLQLRPEPSIFPSNYVEALASDVS